MKRALILLTIAFFTFQSQAQDTKWKITGATEISFDLENQTETYTDNQLARGCPSCLTFSRLRRLLSTDNLSGYYSFALVDSKSSVYIHIRKTLHFQPTTFVCNEA